MFGEPSNVASLSLPVVAIWLALTTDCLGDVDTLVACGAGSDHDLTPVESLPDAMLLLDEARAVGDSAVSDTTADVLGELAWLVVEMLTTDEEVDPAAGFEPVVSTVVTVGVADSFPCRSWTGLCCASLSLLPFDRSEEGWAVEFDAPGTAGTFDGFDALDVLDAFGGPDAEATVVASVGVLEAVVVWMLAEFCTSAAGETPAAGDSDSWELLIVTPDDCPDAIEVLDDVEVISSLGDGSRLSASNCAPAVHNPCLSFSAASCAKYSLPRSVNNVGKGANGFFAAASSVAPV